MEILSYLFFFVSLTSVFATIEYTKSSLQLPPRLLSHHSKWEENKEIRQPAILLKNYLSMLRDLSFENNQKEHLPEEFRGMSSLTSLTIYNSEALEAVPEWIDTLTSLESLEIFKSPRLKSLPHEISNLSNLKTLILVGCSSELEERCQSPSGEDWPKIQHILNITIRPAKNEEE